jgi:hypothetical protein
MEETTTRPTDSLVDRRNQLKRIAKHNEGINVFGALNRAQIGLLEHIRADNRNKSILVERADPAWRATHASSAVTAYCCAETQSASAASARPHCWIAWPRAAQSHRRPWMPSTDERAHTRMCKHTEMMREKAAVSSDRSRWKMASAASSTSTGDWVSSIDTMLW